VRRADDRGNTFACATIEGSAEQIFFVAVRAVRAWIRLDERGRTAEKRLE